jgi:hypothetical protein
MSDMIKPKSIGRIHTYKRDFRDKFERAKWHDAVCIAE